jgi:hypothetical protein
MTLRCNNNRIWDEGVFKGGDNIVERAKNHFDFFMYKLAMTENKDYLSCIAGMMDGLTSNLEYRSKSLEDKNYKVSNKTAIDDFLGWYMIVNSF